MKLFTIGPVEMHDEIKNIGGMQVPYFRTPEFSDMMLDSDKLLKKFLQTDSQSQAIYLTTSGTGAMEAAVMNCLDIHDKVLIINGGTFGNRFVEICNIYNIYNDSIDLSAGETLTADHLEPYNNCNYTALLVNLHETSTGQLYDVQMLSEFCISNRMYFIVDAISTFLCDDYDMDKYGIDVTIVSSQKGLCVAPGLSVVILNNKIVEERIKKDKIKSLYFNFNHYIENMKRGQTPFTPAVGICMQMNKSLHIIEKVGLNNYLNHISNVAADFRNRALELPVKIPKYKLSNAITPILFNEEIALKVFEILKNKFSVIVNPTGGGLNNVSLRISHIGNICISDNENLMKKIKLAISEIKNESLL